MGGGFTARALAEAGHDVLLIERGIEEKSPPARQRSPQMIQKRG